MFCDYIDENSDVNTFEIDRAGTAGAIFSMDFGPFLEPVDFYIPFVAVTPKYDLIKDYLIKTKNSTVDIRFQLTVLDTKPTPIVASFSSRGPDGNPCGY